MPVKPGDHVVFPASAGVWVEVDEERLLICRVGEILGVLDEARDSGSADVMPAP
jgi:chaperonin GroES